MTRTQRRAVHRLEPAGRRQRRQGGEVAHAPIGVPRVLLVDPRRVHGGLHGAQGQPLAVFLMGVGRVGLVEHVLAVFVFLLEGIVGGRIQLAPHRHALLNHVRLEGWRRLRRDKRAARARKVRVHSLLTRLSVAIRVTVRVPLVVVILDRPVILHGRILAGDDVVHDRGHADEFVI